MRKKPTSSAEFRAFARRLRVLRECRFDTARDFARKLGIKENTYTRWERGEVQASPTDSAEKRQIPSKPKDIEAAILAMLMDGAIHDHGAIKKELEEKGFGDGDASFGRALHGKLMALRSRKLIENHGGGQWTIA